MSMTRKFKRNIKAQQKKYGRIHRARPNPETEAAYKKLRKSRRGNNIVEVPFTDEENLQLADGAYDTVELYELAQAGNTAAMKMLDTMEEAGLY